MVPLQFQEGTKLPSTYAFALVENRQGGLLRLRMYVNGDLKGTNTDESEYCPRLLNMKALINEVGKPLWILKVIHYSSFETQ